ncbi:hypothetical protein MVEN_01825700 [Mycena venus]|uniref:Uncharacterized protein n=1 Tax=Mycena venus TaxID=2733690 RepID=A0A8H7CLS6_9AGAR|nr:hypothetical protein MVEN_01825700 [Mycena venus]
MFPSAQLPMTVSEEEYAPLVRHWLRARTLPADSRAFSAKSSKPPPNSGWKIIGAGIENRALPRMGLQRLRRSHSFPAYMHYKEDEEELDDTMPEVREALHVNAALYARGYRYERLDAAQRRHLEHFVGDEDRWAL